VVFVLYNNGFDTILSYYSYQMMLNFIKNLWLIGFMLVSGILVGLVLSILHQDLAFDSQIEYVNNGIRSVFGTGHFHLGNTLLTGSTAIAVRFLSVLSYLWIAQSVIIGYTNTINIDYHAWGIVGPGLEEAYANNANKFRACLIQMSNSLHYKGLKIIIVLSSVVVTMMFLNDSSSVNTLLLAADVYLLCDIACQLTVFGVRCYFSSDQLVKYVYIVSQVCSICLYFLPQIPNEYKVFLHISRIFVLFGCLPQLHSIYLLVKSTLFHPLTQLYKIFMISVSLILVGATLVSFYTGI
jgi:hypothetical protein